jgi:putative ubiquitin-RnfH superfamily antitoxin RatB of RatAB toxin-antitoxin module
MSETDTVQVEVAYATPQMQIILGLDVAEGTTVEDAVHQSGVLQRFPEIELGTTNKVGIFGKLAKLNTPLRAGDRVEIYRALIADPKEIRRQRAAEGKRTGKGGGDLS